MSSINNLTIGTRRSALAMWQTNYISDRLRQLNPHLEISIEKIVTTGDTIQNVPLPKIGDKGLFTREIEDKLIHGEIDIAVHSLKDLPTKLPHELIYAGSPLRADRRDAFISEKWQSIQDIPADGTVATGSLRRKALLSEMKPAIHFTDLRGNIDTRLRKLNEFAYDGIIMAAAALERLDMTHVITEYLDSTIFVPAVGQGAIGIEIRADRPDLLAMISAICDEHTTLECRAERSFMRILEGGCSIPLGASADYVDARMTLSGYVSSVDGQTFIRECITGSASVPEQLGENLAKQFIAKGAREILNGIR